MKKQTKILFGLVIVLSIFNIHLNRNNFLAIINNTSFKNTNNNNYKFSDKRQLLEYIECSNILMFNRSYGVYLPTGFNGYGNPGNCVCRDSRSTFNSSDPLRFCGCPSGYYLHSNGLCYDLADCNFSNMVGHGGYCMSCPEGSIKDENICDCSGRTDGKIHWRVNQCVKCEKTEYTTGNKLHNGSCACYRGQTTAYISYDRSISGSTWLSTKIYLQANIMIRLGTCYVEGSSFTGISYVALAKNIELTSNTGYSHPSCNGGGSYLEYTPDISGYFDIVIYMYSGDKFDLSYSIENIENKIAYGYFVSPDYINYSDYNNRPQDLILKNLSVGDHIEIESFTESHSSYPYRGSGDTHVYLYKSNGIEVAQNDDGGFINNFLLKYNVSESEDYYIRLNSHSSGNVVDANYKLIVKKNNSSLVDFDSHATSTTITNFNQFKSYSYDNQCYRACPQDTINNDDEFICESCNSPISLVIDSTQCSDICPTTTDSVVNNKFCTNSCTRTNSFMYDRQCLSNCPSGKGVFNTMNRYCVDCPTEFPFIHNNYCRSSCPSSYPYIYNSYCYNKCPSGVGSLNGNVNCVTCPNVVYDGICYNSCPTNTGHLPNDSYNCIFCSHVFYNGTCYDECPNNTGITTSDTFNCNACANFMKMIIV